MAFVQGRQLYLSMISETPGQGFRQFIAQGFAGGGAGR